MEKIHEILDLVLFRLGDYKLKVNTIFIILIILSVTKLLLWMIGKAIKRQNANKKIDQGNAYALMQIIRYIIWVLAISFILDTIGVKITVLLAGSAALLVGVGLGLQQIFNDILSGIILLSEKSIMIGDILEIDGDVVKIEHIGLRTSTCLNRDDISIIIPNSLITSNKVINWSHQSKYTRFRIDVGVAYGSDVQLVLKILEESAKEHPDASNSSSVEARMVGFGNSSLDFQLLFFSKQIFRIEKVKSDIRLIIDRKFRENKVTIPFPQMDVYVKQTPKN